MILAIIELLGICCELIAAIANRSTRRNTPPPHADAPPRWMASQDEVPDRDHPTNQRPA
ncbi:MAG: hypothetical protein QM589_09835 [Thermomicrobiales bacterium]